jgi:hypothetical protein
MLPEQERNRSAQVEAVLLVYPLLGIGIFILLLLAVPGLERRLDDEWHWLLWLLCPAALAALITSVVLILSSSG